MDRDPGSKVFAPLAEAYRSLGMVDKALEILRQGIATHPDYLMGKIALANCYMDKGEWANAYTTLRPYVVGNRENIKLQLLFAQAAYEIKHFEDALESYKYLLFFNPRDKQSAERVRELEEILAPNQYQQQAISEKSEDHSEFDLSQLSDDLEADIDEWQKYDLKMESPHSNTFENQIENKESNESEWGVFDSHLKSEEETHGEEDQGDVSHNTELVITHTLVDLYCAQGHIEKALEVLEKILELNPGDVKTLEKHAEVKQLLLEKGSEIKSSEASIQEREDFTLEEDSMANEHDMLLKQFEKKSAELQAKDNQRVIQTLERFLSKIKETKESRAVP